MGTIYHATDTFLKPLDVLQNTFLAEIIMNEKDAILNYNLAPLRLRRDIAIFGHLHKTNCRHSEVASGRDEETCSDVCTVWFVLAEMKSCCWCHPKRQGQCGHPAQSEPQRQLPYSVEELCKAEWPTRRHSRNEAKLLALQARCKGNSNADFKIECALLAA